MMYLQSTAVVTSLLAMAALFLPGAHGSAYVISDDRVRNLDVTPVLGKGYSIMTNSFQSTCLLVDETTVPSYNYDYSFFDFSGSAEYMDVEMASEFSFSFGYWWLKAKVASDKKRNLEIPNRYITSSMRIERYYSSVKEEVSPLSADATTILNNGDYVGFFKACGPAFIRGIRRAQEVIAFIIFSSGSDENAASFTANLQVNQWKQQQSQKQQLESQSMSIVVQGYGLGLRQDGSEALLASTLEDYNKIMIFAFKQMTVLEGDNLHIGMVYGMEVTPWVNNIAFQIQTNLLDEVIEVPIIRSIIPRAYKIEDPTIRTFVEAERSEFRCKNILFSIDRYGYCCELGSLYNYATGLYELGTLSERICRPVSQLDPAFVKDNMAANGEFVARLDRSVRAKMNQLSLLERCIGAARAIPERQNYHILLGEDTVKVAGAADIKFTVFELKMALDPFNDHAMLYHMSKELDEFLDRFIQPCYAALFGTNVGNSPDTDVSYFMAYPWHSHDECTKLSCLGNGMRWDRSSPRGGCVPSMIAGPSAPSYDPSSDKKCKQEVRNGELVCKDSSAKLAQNFARTAKVWGAVVSGGRVDYFLETFCMPTLSGEVLDSKAQYYLREAHLKSLGIPITEKKPLNIALNKPTKQKSTHAHYKSSYANDGVTDGVWNRGFGSHTVNAGETDPWWEVDLEEEFEITDIKVYNRQDCCSNRLTGFKVEIFNGQNPTPQWTSITTDTVPEYETSFKEQIGINKFGDRVRVTIPGGDKVLHLMEVEVITMYEANFPRGTILENNEELYSDNKLFYLKMQTDGNLVIYDVKRGKPTWASNTFTRSNGSGYKLLLSDDGELSVVAGDTMKQWTAELPSGVTTASNAYVVVSDDGNLQIWKPGAQPLDDHSQVFTSGYSGVYYIKSVHNNYVSVSSSGYLNTRRGYGVPGNYEKIIIERAPGGQNSYVLKSASREDANSELKTFLDVNDRGANVLVKTTWNKYLKSAEFYIEYLGGTQIAIKSAVYDNFLRPFAGDEGKFDTQYYIGGWERMYLIETVGPDTDTPLLHGLNWSPRHKLGRCEGDCDSDGNCGTYKGERLYCYHRSDRSAVPGCRGSGKNYADYCVRHSDCNGGFARRDGQCG